MHGVAVVFAEIFADYVVAGKPRHDVAAVIDVVSLDQIFVRIPRAHGVSASRHVKALF